MPQGRQFLHANSPSELAKREAQGPITPEKPRGFRHWNHPEEIAKRAAAAGQAASVPAATAPAPERAAVELPSPAAAGAATVPRPFDSLPPVLAGGRRPAQAQPPQQPGAPTAMQRLRDLEEDFAELLVDLFGEEEANQEEARRMFRVLVLDFPLMKESQLTLMARTRALAQAIGLEWHPDGALGPPLPPTPDPPLFPGLDATATPEPPTRPDPDHPHAG